ncbi:hypothetical protein HY772_09850 [Candidatus Woesearchaeota archaeon]|nr:hypothetical protein [Candidatus Woesearchaeota archaeon]
MSGFGTNVHAATGDDLDPADAAFFDLVVEKTMRLADARILPHNCTVLELILAKKIL